MLRIGGGASTADHLRAAAAAVSFTLLLAALVFATLIGTGGLFSAQARRTARFCLIALLALALLLLGLSSEPGPDL